MTTLVIGVGNPIAGDDGVGLHVLRQLEKAGPGRGVEFREAATGGLALVEMMLGYARVIVVDAIASREFAVGEVVRLEPEALRGTALLSSPHDTTFTAALELMKQIVPEQLPRELVIIGVGIGPSRITQFGPRMSPAVKAASEKAAGLVLAELERPHQ